MNNVDFDPATLIRRLMSRPGRNVSGHMEDLGLENLSLSAQECGSAMIGMIDVLRSERDSRMLVWVIPLMPSPEIQTATSLSVDTRLGLAISSLYLLGAGDFLDNADEEYRKRLHISSVSHRVRGLFRSWRNKDSVAMGDTDVSNDIYLWSSDLETDPDPVH